MLLTLSGRLPVADYVSCALPRVAWHDLPQATHSLAHYGQVEKCFNKPPTRCPTMGHGPFWD